MGNIEMREIYESSQLKNMEGCLITSVTGVNEEGDGGICIDCVDKDKNLISFISLSDGTLYFYDSKKKTITAQQFGDIALLSGCCDVDSVHFLNAKSFTEIIIKVISPNAAERVLAILKDIFPMLVVNLGDWEFEGDLQPMYLCNDRGYCIDITIAVMPAVVEGIGGN